MAITRCAPMISADWIANSPTGPQPHTATVSPGSISAFSARHPAGRQDVGQEQNLIVVEMIGNDDRADVGIRHADIFGLPAGIAAGEVRIAERRRPSGGPSAAATRPIVSDGIAVVAGAILLLLAEEAVAAADR